MKMPTIVRGNIWGKLGCAIGCGMCGACGPSPAVLAALTGVSIWG